MASRKKINGKDWKFTFLKHLEKTLNVAKAARMTGITRERVHQRMNAEPDFKQEVEEARQICVGDIEAKGAELAKKGNVSMIQYYLKSHLPETYGDKKDFTVHGDPDNPLGVVVVPDLKSVDDWNNTVADDAKDE